MYTVVVGHANGRRPVMANHGSPAYGDSPLDEDKSLLATDDMSVATEWKRSLAGFGRFLREARNTPFTALRAWAESDAEATGLPVSDALNVASAIYRQWQDSPDTARKIQRNRVGADDILALAYMYFVKRAELFGRSESASDALKLLSMPFGRLFTNGVPDDGMRLGSRLTPDKIAICRVNPKAYRQGNPSGDSRFIRMIAEPVEASNAHP